MITTVQFELIRRLALRLAGIELVERHREVIARRCRRLGIADIAGVDVLLTDAKTGEPESVQKFLRLLTTKFTGFFRIPRHFDIVAEHAVRSSRQGRRPRLWSAAAASGEEPYSIGMALLEAFPQGNPPADILATDVDADVLATAQRGEYGELALKALTAARRERFFAETKDSRRWAITPSVRRMVEFRVLNLVSSDWRVEGPFDAIFCRNILMYLQAEHRRVVLQRMASLLAPRGLLLLDPAEHLGPAAHLFTSSSDGVYALRTAGAPKDGTTASLVAHPRAS